MPFGLGLDELVLALLSLAVPFVLLVLAARLLSRMFGSGRRRPDEIEHPRVAADLRQAQLRIEELEARLAQVDEKASFTQDLLEKPRSESMSYRTGGA